MAAKDGYSAILVVHDSIAVDRAVFTDNGFVDDGVLFDDRARHDHRVDDLGAFFNGNAVENDGV